MSGFQHVTGKLGNMRKAAEWTVYGAKEGATKRTIQCKGRIAEIDLETGKAMLSSGKKGNGFVALSPFLGATEVDCCPSILQQLKNLDEDHGPQGDTFVIDGTIEVVHARTS